MTGSGEDRIRRELALELERWLAPAEAAALEAAPREPRPFLLLVGAPRGGVGLALKWLAESGCFAYPTRFVAEFGAAATIGARIQRLWLDPAAPAPSGARDPDDSSAFWTRYLRTSEHEPLGARVKEVDVAALRRALAALGAAYGRPLAAIGVRIQYDLEFFAGALAEAMFVHVVRDGPANAHSLLEARRRILHSDERWYGARPPEYKDLVALPPVEQVVGQVHFTNRRIASALDALPSERSFRVAYEELCAAPADCFAQLIERWTKHASSGRAARKTAAKYAGPAKFEPPRRAFDRRPWEEAWQRCAGSDRRPVQPPATPAR